MPVPAPNAPCNKGARIWCADVITVCVVNCAVGLRTVMRDICDPVIRRGDKVTGTLEPPPDRRTLEPPR